MSKKSSVNDPRLGHRPAGKKPVWPKVDVKGDPYSRPATTKNIGDEYFVVIPMGQGYAKALAEVAALITPPAESKPVEKPEATQEATTRGSNKRESNETDSAARAEAGAEKQTGDA